MRSAARLVGLIAAAGILAAACGDSSGPDAGAGDVQQDVTEADGAPDSDDTPTDATPGDATQDLDSEGPPGDGETDDALPSDAADTTSTADGGDGAADGTVAAEPVEWQLVEEAYGPGALLSGWAPGDGSVWFACGQLGEPVVLELSSGGWTAHDPGFGAQAWWGHGWDSGRQIVVGDGGSIAVYDGTWSDQTPPGYEGTTLYGVWGATPDDVWAVGGAFLQAPDGLDKVGNVLLHWDGTGWEAVALPDIELPSDSGSFFKVWGAGSDAVWVVGSGGLILHYDGSAWTREVVEGIGKPALFTVSGRSADDVWAVGGGAKSVLLHRDASGWSEVELPTFAPQILQGIHAASHVHVSGAFGFTASLTPEGEWLQPDPVTTQQLHAILETPDALYAVGGNIATLNADYDGTFLISGSTVPALPGTR